MADGSFPTSPEQTEKANGIFQIYLNEVGRHRRLTHKEELELGRRKDMGENEAVDNLCRANQRLVISIARRYSWCNMSLSDLIQEGNIGLLKAARKFDHKRGLKFATLATRWIRGEITRAISKNDKTVRLSDYMRGQIQILAEVRNELIETLGFSPSDDQLIEALVEQGIKNKRAKKVLSTSRLRVVSMDTTNDGDDDGVSLGESIKDYSLPDENGLIEMIEPINIEDFAEPLSPLQWQVIYLRYAEEETQKAIGDLIGVSRARIGQIQQRAIEIIRDDPTTMEKCYSL